MIEEHVFLQISAIKKVMRLGKKGKLSLRYVKPFEILERLGVIAYWLALPLEFPSIYLMFHVFMLRKYLLNPSHVI